MFVSLAPRAAPLALSRGFVRSLSFLTVISLGQPASAQLPPESETPAPVDAESPPASDRGVASTSSSTPEELFVYLVLLNTPLTEEAVLAALEKEFRVPVVPQAAGYGLVVRVEGSQLTVSYIDEDGGVVRRNVELPKDEGRQLDTIALLSGNLARDEAGALLAQLQKNAPPPVQEPAAQEPPPKPANPPPSTTDQDELRAPPESPPPDPIEDIPTVGFSASLTGDVSYPKELNERRSHFELGLLQSKVGALDGAALSLLASHNLGLGDPRRNRGLQMALIWTSKQRGFRGVMLSLASGSQGDLNGAQVTGMAGLQKGELNGAQVSGMFSFASGEVIGAQLAGLTVGAFGDFVGAQLGGLASFVDGNLEGVQLGGLMVGTSRSVRGAQLAGLGAYAGELHGAQLAPIPVAGVMDGFQLGLASVAHRRMSGLQLGLVNVAGQFKGTQIGLVNVGGRGRATQVGLLNVAARNEGTPVGLLNVIPNLRTQLVTFGSYSPHNGQAGVPKGALYHVGIKFMPQPLYTQLTIGFGPSKACPSEDSACSVGEEAYAVGWGMGVHSRLFGVVFSEVDLTYSFERSLSNSSQARHGALLRAALGLQLGPVALVAGGGPRVDFLEGNQSDMPASPQLAPHFFAGLQFF